MQSKVISFRLPPDQHEDARRIAKTKNSSINRMTAEFWQSLIQSEEKKNVAGNVLANATSNVLETVSN